MASNPTPTPVASGSSGLTSFMIYQRLQNFEGPATFPGEIENYIQIREKEARRQDAKEAIGQIITSVKERIDRYFAVVDEITDYTESIAMREIKSGFEIEDIRTNFNLDNLQIKILFVVNANIENELVFARMLSNIEKEILFEKNRIAELLFFNIQNCQYDKEYLDQDYPFFRKKENKK